MSSNPMSRRPHKTASEAPQSVSQTFREVPVKLTSFNIEQPLHTRMKMYAIEHGMTMTDLIHVALRDYMDNNS